MTAKDLLLLPISGQKGASSRYRLYQYSPMIEAAGLSTTTLVPQAIARNKLRRILNALADKRSILREAEDCRGVFLQKRLFEPRFVEKLLKNRKMAFDFDDAIFTTPNGDFSAHSKAKVLRRLRFTLSSASVVIAGNRYLGDYARQHNASVIELPTVVDLTRYAEKQHAPKPNIVIGWIGHSVNHPYVFGLGKALEKLAAEYKITLLVISDRDISIPNVDTVNRRWSERTEGQDILDMDIGIMPLPDDPWSRGKCGLKALQYMAAGVPVVCSAVGANIDIVRQGSDGFLARTDDEWIACLSLLCGDSALRASLGRSARERVDTHYSLKTASPIFIDALKAIAAR